MKLHRHIEPRLVAYSVLVILFVAPFVGMQFSEEVNWSVLDFFISACLLGSFAFICEKCVILSSKTTYKIGAIVLAFSFGMLMWINLGVGMVGDNSEAANFLYYFVPAFSALIAVKSKFTAYGMLRASIFAAMMHLSITVAILWFDLVSIGEQIAFIMLSNGIFIALYLFSIAFFWLAKRD